MINNIRQKYNANFKIENYQKMLEYLHNELGAPVLFRVAETPVFVPNSFKQKLLIACEEIFDSICQPDFNHLTEGSLIGQSVPGEDAQSIFMQVDFGVCIDTNGELSPKLIEIQGFPSLYAFQATLGEAYQKHFDIPEGMTTFFNGYDKQTYIELLRECIVGNSKPENTILLEIDPEKQGTNIDFYASAKYWGIKILDLKDLKRNGRQLYYIENGQEIKVERIYNRVIFDDLQKRTDLDLEYDFTQEVDVHWVGHPNWFFRISKFTLPILKSQYVPKSYFLHELTTFPKDLENFVLKPLYSFAGMGVKINITEDDILEIPLEERKNYILQQKVNYAPVIQTPNEPAKCEIRMMVIWKPGWPRPKVVNNICRLSKGIMVGVRYNKDKDWVGGTVCFFEKD